MLLCQTFVMCVLCTTSSDVTGVSGNSNWSDAESSDKIAWGTVPLKEGTPRSDECELGSSALANVGDDHPGESEDCGSPVPGITVPGGGNFTSTLTHGSLDNVSLFPWTLPGQ